MRDLNFLYDQLLEQMARLHGFCSMSSNCLNSDSDTDEDIEHVCQLIFKRDLLLFAATLRNFSESVFLKRGMKQVKIHDSEVCFELGPPFFKNKGTTTNLYQCVSRILHSRYIEVRRTVAAYVVYYYKEEDVAETYKKIIDEQEKYNLDSLAFLEPLLEITTEHEPTYLVSLRNILLATRLFLDAAFKALDSKDLVHRKAIRDF